MTDAPTIEESLRSLAAHIAKKAQEENVDLTAAVKAFQALNQYIVGLKKAKDGDEPDEPKKTTTFDELRERVRLVKSDQEFPDGAA